MSKHNRIINCKISFEKKYIKITINGKFLKLVKLYQRIKRCTVSFSKLKVLLNNVVWCVYLQS